MHSTPDLDDGYLGSGKRLKSSVKKYGEENFKREILEFFESRDLLKKREAELVNDDLLKDPKCMNLQHGGGGGFSSEEHKLKCLTKGRNTFQEKIKTDKDLLDQYKENGRKLFLECWKDGRFKQYDWNGHQHKKETKIQIGKSNSISQSGSKNSQYETHWITNGKENKKISKTDLIPDGWKLGRKIKID
jgi:hypothetical protein